MFLLVILNRWDNGEAELMSPWDLELIDENGKENMWSVGFS